MEKIQACTHSIVDLILEIVANAEARHFLPPGSTGAGAAKEAPRPSRRRRACCCHLPQMPRQNHGNECHADVTLEVFTGLFFLLKIVGKISTVYIYNNRTKYLQRKRGGATIFTGLSRHRFSRRLQPPQLDLLSSPTCYHWIRIRWLACRSVSN